MPPGTCLLAKSGVASRPGRPFRLVQAEFRGVPLVAASCEGKTAHEAGWTSPRWVPLMVYVVVLAAGLYYAAMGLGGVVPVGRVAGFAVAMTVLLGLEAADRRWLVRPRP